MIEVINNVIIYVVTKWYLSLGYSVSAVKEYANDGAETAENAIINAMTINIFNA